MRVFCKWGDPTIHMTQTVRAGRKQVREDLGLFQALCHQYRVLRYLVRFFFQKMAVSVA